MFYPRASQASPSRGHAMARLARVWCPQVQGPSAVALPEHGVFGLTAKSLTASGRPWHQYLEADIDANAKAVSRVPVLSSADVGADIGLRSDSCGQTELAPCQRCAIA